MTEYEINTSSRHTITSDVTLNCAETGRVVAVFYNDYDAEAVLAAATQQAAEPVAWLVDHRLHSTGMTKVREEAEFCEDEGAKITPLYSHPPAKPQGEAVVTWNESKTQILAVTRQDADGLILSVIAEAPVQPEQQSCAECGPVDDGTALYCVRCIERMEQPATEQNAVFPRCECGRMLKSECDWGTSLCPASQGDNNDHD